MLKISKNISSLGFSKNKSLFSGFARNIKERKINKKFIFLAWPFHKNPIPGKILDLEL